MQLMPFPHWLESDLIVAHYWLVLKGLIQDNEGERSQPLSSKCIIGPCVHKGLTAVGVRGKLTYKVLEIDGFEFLILNTVLHHLV